MFISASTGVRVLLDGNEIAGDAVNVACTHQCHGLRRINYSISKSVYEGIYGNEDILCRFHCHLPTVKGKGGGFGTVSGRMEG